MQTAKKSMPALLLATAIVLAACGGETAGQHGRHQHGVDEAAGMPCDVQPTAFGRKVLIIHDVNFAKPDVREKLIETASKAVG